ncbi:FUSC family protein [Kaistia adipata]|uniref:FUSC family protein n=1 Tax=Kaistia adipata TaxID=166954 RepID=UPI000410BF11|nr:FUSC family protein [Kaistia adipata]
MRPREYRPASWLVSLTRLNPKSSWPWRHSTRLAIAITVPMLVGVLVGQVEASMLVCLGALLNSTKVQTDPYRQRLLNFLIVVPMAMAGFVLGSLVAGHGLLTLLFLILVALVSGLVSGYGAAFSTGAMQMLVLAVIGAAHPGSSSLWQSPLLFASGAAFAAALIAVEALFDRHLPERQALSRLLHALAHLARIAADPPKPTTASLATPFEQQRRHVTDAMQAAYSNLLEARLNSEGSTRDSDRRAALLSTIDAIFSRLVARQGTAAEQRSIGRWLDTIAAAQARGGPRPVFDPDPAVTQAGAATIDGLLDELWPDSPAADEPRVQRGETGRAVRRARWRIPASFAELAGHLTLGHEVVVSAFRIALCLAIAFAAQIYLGGVRSYWIPLCVVIVMKPDFGSVFVRAVQRSIGTVIGVGIGVVLLILVPKGVWLIACMGVLGFLLPAAGLRGYAMQCALLTPLVLILIDLSVPGATVDFGPQRLVDTLIGSGISLVFGYLIWPRDPAPRIHMAFSRAMAATTALLQAATAREPAEADITLATLDAYRSVSNVRTTLQRAIAEPPPASREAAAWFPVVVEMERLCDRMAAMAQLNLSGGASFDPAAVAQRVATLEQLGGESSATAKEAEAGTGAAAASDDAAFREIDGGLVRLAQLLSPA